MDEGPEQRAYTLDERESRSRSGPGTRLSLHDKGLATFIGNENKDYFGKSVSTDQRTTLNRLRKWQTRSKFNSSKDRNLTRAMTIIESYGDTLNIPHDVRETASLIYRKAYDKGLVRGRSIDGISIASVYAACRRTPKVQRSLNEIANLAENSNGIKKKDLSRDYRLLVKELDLLQPVQDSKYYVNLLANRFDLSSITPDVNALIDKASGAGLTLGRNPLGIAAAAFYQTCSKLGILKRKDLTQREIAGQIGITEVTLRSRYKELVRELNL
jgi:transcription initiation factor TFIIB